MSDKRQNNQFVLAFREEAKGEAPSTSQAGSEPLTAKREAESPARGERLISSWAVGSSGGGAGAEV